MVCDGLHMNMEGNSILVNKTLLLKSISTNKPSLIEAGGYKSHQDCDINIH